jgi:hypothetical protein
MAVEIDAKTAMRNQAKPQADWVVARRRLRRGVIVPVHRPTFRLRRTDTIFTMGSCFARNIEKYLVRLGCRVPPYDFALPEAERLSPTPNHALTLFTPPMFSQTLEWAEAILSRDGKVTIEDIEPWIYRLTDGTALDLGLAAIRPTGIDRVVARRQEIFDLYVSAFRAECVLLTPGLVEAWYDTHHDIYTNSAPIKGGALLDEARYTFRILDYADCYGALARTVELIRKHNKTVKFLITVSPVPLRYTFSDDDILVANTYSKSVLRAACNQLVRDYDGIDYFPSFEAVSLSTWRVWQRDRRHVTDAMVARIVNTVISQYVLGSRDADLASYREPLMRRIWRSAFGA